MGVENGVRLACAEARNQSRISALARDGLFGLPVSASLHRGGLGNRTTVRRCRRQSPARVGDWIGLHCGVSVFGSILDPFRHTVRPRLFLDGSFVDAGRFVICRTADPQSGVVILEPIGVVHLDRLGLRVAFFHAIASHRIGYGRNGVFDGGRRHAVGRRRRRFDRRRFLIGQTKWRFPSGDVRRSSPRCPKHTLCVV